jgi:threonine dehydratase
MMTTPRTEPTPLDAAEAADRVAARLAAGEAADTARSFGDLVRPTPVLTSRSLSQHSGGRVLLKAENLQRTGSFKLRGALSKLAALGRPTLVVTASAGNHGQSVAYAARARSVPCEVFMPRDAAVSKVAAVRAFDGIVHVHGDSVDDCVAAARARADEVGGAFVHPFDDPEIVLGQATLGRELLADTPDLARVIVPVGGGGLVSGVAGAIKSVRPEVEVIGIQAAACAPVAAARRGGAAAPQYRPTIADGIAVKHPGRLNMALIDRWVDEMRVVEEDDVAEAMVWLLERSKLVVEGAGAVGVAALLSGGLNAAPEGSTVVVLSGGNVDAGLLALVAQRHETGAGRRLRCFTRIADRPGGLADLLTLVAESGANVRSVEHVREAVPLHVRQSGVELLLETRGDDHARDILAALADAGYEVHTLPAGEGPP